MNSYERYINTIKGKPVDFLPRTPILMQYAAEHIGSNYYDFALDYKILVESNIKCAEDFGMDQLSCISDACRETQGFGAKIKCFKDSAPQGTRPLGDNKDLSLLLKPDPYKSERMFDIIKAAGIYKEKYEGKYSILGWIAGATCEASELRDICNFLIDLKEDEAYARELMDICLNVGIEYARAQIKAGCDTIGIGDAVVSLISPKTYEKLIFQYQQKLVKAIQEMGGYVKMHICGNITHLLPGIAELNVDIIDVDHMVDMEKVRKILGTKVVLTGNLDPVEEIKFSTPKRIREGFKELYDKVGNPFMVNAGCEVPSNTPVENLMAIGEPIAYQK